MNIFASDSLSVCTSVRQIPFTLFVSVYFVIKYLLHQCIMDLRKRWFVSLSVVRSLYCFRPSKHAQTFSYKTKTLLALKTKSDVSRSIIPKMC